MYCTARIIFFPLFLLCRIPGSQLPEVFSKDAFPILLMIIFALSNGYLSSSCMMGPTLVEPRDSMLTGTLMIFSLTLGLMSGAAFSFINLLISQGKISD
jgi:equilibrative nucleoside transporter 1/2/3